MRPSSTGLSAVFLLLSVIASDIVPQTPSNAEIVPALCWRFASRSVPRYAAVDGNVAVITSDGGNLEAVSTIDGKLIWSTDLGGDIVSNVVQAGRRSWVVSLMGPETSPQPILRAVSTETGLAAWNIRLPHDEQYYLAASNGNVIVTSSSGAIQSISSESGKIVWKRESPGPIAAAPIVAGAKITLLLRNSALTLVDASSGSILSTRGLSNRPTAVASLASGELILGDDRGNISVLNGGEKPLWRFKTGGEVSRLTVVGDSILAASHDNFVYSLSLKGDVIWKRRMAGRVVEARVLDDRSVIMAGLDDRVAVIGDLRDGRTIGQIPLEDSEGVTNSMLTGRDLYLLTDRALVKLTSAGCVEK